MSDSNELLPEAVLPEVYTKVNQVQRKRYLVGLLPDGPAGNQTFAGICFPVYTEGFDAEGNPFRKEGAVVELTAEQCKSIKEAIRNRVVRWRFYGSDHPQKERQGQRLRAEIHDVRVRGFVPMNGDEPMVKYVFFKEAPPEAERKPAPAEAFAELDKAIAAAADAELKALADPEDAATRAKHGALKKAGQKLSDQV